MNLIEKILNEAGVLDQKIKNTETGRQIKVSSALEYDDSKPVKKAAQQLINKSKEADKEPAKQPKKSKENDHDAKVTPSGKKNERSHKPKSNSYGISKECVSFLKEKGLTGLNVLPQSFVSTDQIIFNPELEKQGKDNVWACKFPVKLPNGKDAMKTAYTKNFMQKSQIKKYKKISKISEKDISSLEEKTNKLLNNKEQKVSDSACVLAIILKTGLRIGSVDKADSGNVGVRTLKKSNINIKGKKISLKFIGKSYQENVANFEDESIAGYLTRILQDKKTSDNVFSCSYETVGNVMDKINPKGINPKDLRTYKATEFAKKCLQDKKLGMPPPLPKDEKEIKKVVKEKLAKVFEATATFLNNTPAMAKNSYVHPAVITDYLKNLGLEPKQVGYKHITMEGKEPKSSDIKFTSMDQMFANNKKYSEGSDAGISEDDSYDCEEYLLPEWFYDENWILVKK